MYTKFLTNNLIFERKKYTSFFLNIYIPKELAELISEYDHQSNMIITNCIFLDLIELAQKHANHNHQHSNNIISPDSHSINDISKHVQVIMNHKTKITYCSIVRDRTNLRSFFFGVSRRLQIMQNDSVVCKCIIENDNLLFLIQTLISLGLTVTIHFYAYKSVRFNNGKTTGIIPIPTQTELSNDIVEVAANFEAIEYEPGYLISRKFWNYQGICKLPTEYLTSHKFLVSYIMFKLYDIDNK